ncbi:MAG: anti-sigma factor antagonist [Planctomycetota bacterium]|nr:MAG: anti-sigma factor antagonist [Planctomycetota bacterium]
MSPPTYQLSHEVQDTALVVRASGKFDREAAVAVEALILPHAGLRILNLAAVEYISSSGIAGLVKLSARAGLRIASPAECVRNALSLAGIEPILSIFPDEVSARASR